MGLILIFVGVLIGYYYFLNKENNNKQNKNNQDFWDKYNNPTFYNNSRYNNHCWNCGEKIDSFYNERCPKCGWYICSKCGACMNKPNCTYERK